MDKTHVHETNPKRTFITVVIFVLIIIAGLLTLRDPNLKYALSPQHTVELVSQEEHVMFPYELEDIFSGAVDTVMLIDIRDKFEFGRGHIEGAENISAISLLRQENLEILREAKENGMTIVIYGNDQLEANGPWMVFRQLGFDNIKVLLGGYDFFREWKDMLGDTYYEDSYLLGAPRFDFAEVAAAAPQDPEPAGEGTNKPVTVKRKKKSSVAEGGC